MGDAYPVIRVAAVQASPVFLDRNASIEKARRLIRDAGRGGAKLAVFPEAWVPGYPVWFDAAPGAALWDHQPTKEVYARLFANAVEVPSPAVAALAEAASEAGCAVIMGINEREGGTLYCTLVGIDADGRLVGKHRKLMPTHAERMVWGMGDGSTLTAFDFALGRIGGLLCWEHWMPLARHGMHVEGEQIHAALWPDVPPLHQLASRHYAFEGRCFVIAAGAVLRRGELPTDLALLAAIGGGAEDFILQGGSAIIGPDGEYLAGPMGPEEGILIADLDFALIPAARMTFDAVGHYSRPDVFSVTVDRTPRRQVVDR